MDLMDEILNYQEEGYKPIIMDSNEYFAKTKKLLQKIENAYSKAWQNRVLKEYEFPEESICDKCDGCGLFKKEDGEQYECFIDHEEGECFTREFNAEEFGIEAECEMDEVFSLLCVDELQQNKDMINDMVLIASIDAKTKEGKFCCNIAKMSLKK